MKCPNCETDMIADQLRCKSCNYNMHLFSELQFLKNETNSITQNLRTNLRKSEVLKNKIANIETAIHRYLKKESKPKESIAITKPVQAEDIKAKIPLKAKSSIPSSLNLNKSEIQFGQKWLLIIGIIILVLGIGYFLKYSFEQNWVNPIVRVSGVFLTGSALLFAGNYFRKKLSKNFGLYLTGGGIATLYFASFSAFHLYKLLGQVSSFSLMILITCLTCCLSLFYNNKWLAVLGLIGGFITPLMLSTGNDAQIALMSYMLLLNAGILFIGLYKQWGLLNNWGFVLTWLLYSGWFFNHYNSSKFLPSIIFLNLFFLIYAIVPFAYYLKQERQEKLKGLTSTIFNSFISFGFAYKIITSKFAVEYLSILSVSYAALFICMANYLLKQNKKNIEPLALTLTKSSFFLIITIPILFSGHWITIFWVLQSLVLFWLANKINHQNIYNGAYFLLAISLYKFLFYDYPEVFSYSFTHFFFQKGFTYLLKERVLNVITTLTSLFIISKIIANWVINKKNNLSSDFQWKFLMSTFLTLLFIALNFETRGFFHDYLPKATFASVSVLWAIFASGLLSIGFIKRVSILRKCAIFLYAATIVKVFFKDMAHVSTPFRILSFMVLGALLILASYLYYRFKDRIYPSETKENIS